MAAGRPSPPPRGALNQTGREQTVTLAGSDVTVTAAAAALRDPDTDGREAARPAERVYYGPLWRAGSTHRAA